MEMACQAMYRWSLIGLVAAFLDLALAYFLLCASAIAFMASKFLGFFGLYLPCPSCYAVIGADPNRSLCFQKLLIEYPTEKVSNVQLSVMSKFPFNDSVWGKDQNSNFNLRLIEDRKRDVVELEADGSCSSLVSDARKSNTNMVRINGEMKNARNENGSGNLLGFRDGRFDLKGKGMMHQRPKSGIRRRRKEAFDYGKYPSVSSYDPPCGQLQQVDPPHSPPSINKGRSELVDHGIELQGYGGNRLHFNYSEEGPTVARLRNRSSNMHELNELTDEHEHISELKSNVRTGLDFNSEYKNTIRLLEQALEEEHAACDALYLELEKERSAAASAADEAMAMIQRLQEEKASIEMEARQYQRMIEEKSAYDAEEMNILKEIIVRREREKHFLEKEVEEVQQLSHIRNEQSSGDVTDMLNCQQPNFDSSFDPNEDPVLMLQQISASIDKKVMIETKKADDVISIDKGKGILAPSEELTVQKLDESSAYQKQGHPAGHLSQFSVCKNDDSANLQDKMISMDNNSYAPAGDLQSLESFSQLCKPDTSQGKLPETTTILMGKGCEYSDNINMLAKTRSHIPYGSGSLKLQEIDSNLGIQSSYNVFHKEPHVHDVHVIVDSPNLCNQVNASDLECRSVNSRSEIHRKHNDPSENSAFQRVNATSDCQSTSRLDAKVDIRRSSSDITSSLQPKCPKGKSLLSDLRRNSSSVVDNERLKIDYEVGWLQERLRVVQEGREKLNLSVEHQEREKMQLKLLENKAIQLQEIRQLTEPGKAVRQASLPPPSSKVISKKRRCRSVSSNLQTT